MKNFKRVLLTPLFVLGIVSITFTSCKGPQPKASLSLSKSTVDSSSAQIYILINYNDYHKHIVAKSKPISSGGICYSTFPNPTKSDQTVVISEKINVAEYPDEQEFSLLVPNLKNNTTYYLKAFAENKDGIVYSNEATITTSYKEHPVPPAVATNTATSVSYSSAVVNGKLLSSGGISTEYGFCWSTTAKPTTSKGSGNTITVGTTSGTPLYSYKIVGLTQLTLYHVRSYAKNDKGIVYGADVTFTTTTNSVTTLPNNTPTIPANLLALLTPSQLAILYQYFPQLAPKQ